MNEDTGSAGYECWYSQGDLDNAIRATFLGSMGSFLTAVDSIDTVSVPIHAVCLAVAIFHGGTHGRPMEVGPDDDSEVKVQE